MLLAKRYTLKKGYYMCIRIKNRLYKKSWKLNMWSKIIISLYWNKNFALRKKDYRKKFRLNKW